MDFFHDVYGNRPQKELFTGLIREGRLSHSYILEAPVGGGKKTFAYRIAATLAYAEDQSPEGMAKCRRILEGNSPDVKCLSRAEDKKTIGVDAARDFLSSIYLTPSELGFKLYIFDEADRLTPQAQNALLKSIEEPPQNVYILFLCENSLSLLATVRSRTQKVALQRFSEGELASFAKADEALRGIDEEKLTFATRMARGTVGRLRTMLKGGEEEFAAYQKAKETVTLQAAKAGGKSGSYYAFLRGICDFAGSKEAFDAYTEYLLTAYGDLIAALREEMPPPSFFTAEEAETLAMSLSLHTVKDSFAATDSVRADMRFHVNVSLAAATLGMRLWSAV